MLDLHLIQLTPEDISGRISWFLPRNATLEHVRAHCHGKSSVCPPVTLSYRGHIRSNTSKISQLISLGFTLYAGSDIMDLFQREHATF